MTKRAQIRAASAVQAAQNNDDGGYGVSAVRLAWLLLQAGQSAEGAREAIAHHLDAGTVQVAIERQLMVAPKGWS